jgi:hypothetical protein
VLPIPQFGDSMNELLSKLTAIGNIVRVGKSITEAAAFSAAPIQDRKAEEIALSQMWSQEHDAWTTLNDGLWWITNNKIVLLRLVQAMARVIGAEKTLLVDVVDGWQLSLQTCRRSTEFSLSRRRYVKKANRVYFAQKFPRSSMC